MALYSLGPCTKCWSGDAWRQNWDWDGDECVLSYSCVYCGHVRHDLKEN